MSNFKEYLDYDGLGLAELIKNKEITPNEVLEAAISISERVNPKINALVLKMYEQAKKQISQIDIHSRFAGVPFLIKDLGILLKNEPLNCGSRFLHNFKPQINCELVNRFEKTGLVVIGKTTTPEFGLGFVTEPIFSGATRNPWDLNHTTGGSSGGSAAAVAAGITPLASASDGGGSIRVPASCCGLFGLKSSRGRTPSGPVDGKVWQGMSVSSVISRSVRDSAAALDAIAGPDIGAPYYLPPVTETYFEKVKLRPRSLKIAVCRTPFFGNYPLHPDCERFLNETVAVCESLGHHVVEAKPSFDANKAEQAFYTIIAGEMATLINELSKSLKRKPKRDELEIPAKLFSKLGCKLSANDFCQATHHFDSLTRTMAYFFQQYDLILTPTLMQPPITIGYFAPKPFEKMMSELLYQLAPRSLLRFAVSKMAQEALSFSAFTQLFNITGNPAMSVPLHWNTAGLPIGMQFAADVGREDLLFQVAGQLEEAKPWKKQQEKVFGMMGIV